MLIGITGDTHGDFNSLKLLAARAAGAADEWLHTGDLYQDANTLRNLYGFNITAVAGNNDFAAGPDDYDKILMRAGYKIWLTHGHRYRSLSAQNQQINADIIVCGHTHVPNIFRQEGVLFINPGSPALPRRGSAQGFVLLTLETGTEPSAVFCPLE